MSPWSDARGVTSAAISQNLLRYTAAVRGDDTGGASVAAKCALVVDDSKSARTFLAKMLEKYELEVVSVESAEQAIEYLAHHRPDVIFMDHMMPGMDGFQAVQTIKNNPRTATIPIMMYTSQEGELYLGQARALGAVGVLPKQIRPADVSKVLYQLHLLPERRRAEQGSFRQLNGSVVEIDDGAESAPPVARPLTEAALRGEIAELRRMLVATLDSQAERLKSELSGMIEEAARAGRHDPLPRRARWLAIAAGIALIVAAASLMLAAQQAGRSRALAGDLAALRAQLAGAPSASRGSAANVPQVPAASAAPAQAAGTVARSTAAAQMARRVRTAGPASAGAGAPVIEVVPYGEDPFGGPRLDSLRQLFDRVLAQGYHGTVEVRVFPGRFCLAGNSADGFSLAPDETPFAKCDIVGNAPSSEDPGAPQHVSVAFADLVDELRSASHGTVDVLVAEGDESSTLVAYPPVSDALTAGEWNRAGSANNRIEIRLR